MKRIMIVGGPGSGKSTLARGVGVLLGLPIFHFDHILWKPGWVMRPEEEGLALLKEIVAGEESVIEGNHSRTYAVRTARADTLVFLDMPRRLRMARLIRRWLSHRGKTRPDPPPGGLEQLAPEFFRWSWNWDRRARPKALRLVEECAGLLVVHILRSPAEVREFEEALRKGTS